GSDRLGCYRAQQQENRTPSALGLVPPELGAVTRMCRKC
ncbi:hypothetical protein A2U01_0083987, partial [Trifolium medium]|nr:hypothetical protein [Trifolium medium]